jgi:hypothetical protein
VEIDGDRTVLACRFGGVGHVSSPLGWRWVQMRHDEHNTLKDQAYCGKLRALPLNPGESEQALEEVANIVKPDTILAWHRKLVAEKFLVITDSVEPVLHRS